MCSRHLKQEREWGVCLQFVSTLPAKWVISLPWGWESGRFRNVRISMWRTKEWALCRGDT